MIQHRHAVVNRAAKGFLRVTVSSLLPQFCLHKGRILALDLSRVTE